MKQLPAIEEEKDTSNNQHYMVDSKKLVFNWEPTEITYEIEYVYYQQEQFFSSIQELPT